MFRVLFVQTFLILTLSIWAVAQQSEVKPSTVTRIRGNVLAVEDGDRLKIATDDGNVTSVILQGVDAPDEKQDYFKKAKKRLADLVEGKDVTVMLRTAETGESFAVIYADADDVGFKLIQEGLAWFAPNRSLAQNKADREKYSQAESAAKTSKTGLWSGKDAVAPWTFRGEKLISISAETTNATSSTNTASPHRSQPVPGRTYVLGPRGGCYYLNDQGIKVYVKDKTLCQKQ
jgi:endonuclease YncB( thermonuclease family)